MSEVGMSTDTEPTDDDFRWLGFTEPQVNVMACLPPAVRRTVYLLQLEEMMSAGR